MSLLPARHLEWPGQRPVAPAAPGCAPGQAQPDPAAEAHTSSYYRCFWELSREMDQVKELTEVPQKFIKEGTQFINRCTKPDQKEFAQICKAVAIGFALMGFIGYFVKLIHIPINGILVGGA
ncbi:hypothetical protein O181_104527 [Austropuccinia psidii MF-1]|uniref:Protein transport protein Sec61 subunit gamma n=1 Tax=Austropuccinia psidii MF-1 TaxID=1389203 RepID=A0A9Q3JN83_9BASI|nr:hypothetical protein [Austropuccinia psidii MF-1]